jgi:hypothetical protein
MRLASEGLVAWRRVWGYQGSRLLAPGMAAAAAAAAAVAVAMVMCVYLQCQKPQQALEA